MTIRERIENKLVVTSDEWAHNMRKISDSFFDRENNVGMWKVRGDTLTIVLRCLHSELLINMVLGAQDPEEKAKTEEELQKELKPLLDGKNSPLAKYMTTHLNHVYDADGLEQGYEESELACVSCKATKWDGSSCIFDTAEIQFTYFEPEVVLKFKGK